MDATHLGQQVAVAVVEALQDRRQSLATSVVSRSRCIPMNARITFSSAMLRYSTDFDIPHESACASIGLVSAWKGNP